ncbi:MAG: phosphotransferase family protein [Pirellulales bacterium]
MSELDIEQTPELIEWLRASGHIGRDETPAARRLTGGVSNRTVLVQRVQGEAWVLKQALRKLRVTVDWFSDPSRSHREADGIRHFRHLAPAGSVPELLFEDRASHVVAMRAVPCPHENFKTQLLAGRVDDDLIRQFAVLLATVQSRATERRLEMASYFGDRSYFEALRLEPYYAYSALQVPAVASFLTHLVDATRARCFTLVHGDYSPKNVLVHRGQVVLLDYEVIHFGDGAFDIGFVMAHLLSKAHHLSAFRLQFARAAHLFWKTYQETVSPSVLRHDVSLFAVRHTLGCLLARAVGRSPLEYLSAAERTRQAETVTRLMASVPETVPETIDQFMEQIPA